MAVDVRERVSTGPGLPLPSGPDGWTVADLDLLPDDGLRYELLDGTLLVSPAPTPRHQRATRSLLLLLIAACAPEFEVFTAPLDWQPGAGRSFQPDLLVMRRRDVRDDRLAGMPRLVVEVLSSSTAALDRGIKRAAYAEGSVAQYWIVDPGVAEDGADCAVEVYDLVDGAYVLQTRAVGNEVAAVSGPVPVRVVPGELVR